MQTNLIKYTSDLLSECKITTLKKHNLKENDLFLFNHPSNTSKIGWIKKNSLLIALRKLLFAYGLIECEYEPFRKHFFGKFTGKISYVIWLGDITQLVYMFDKLIMEKYIPNHSNRRHIILKEHFCDRYGSTLDNKSMRTLLSKMSNQSIGCSIIDEIFDRINDDLSTIAC